MAANKPRASISSFVCDDGMIVQPDEDIFTEIVNFCKKQLGTSITRTVKGELSSLSQLLSVTLTDDQKHMLVANIDRKEIAEVIKHMPKNKALGPDGFPVEFFLKA